VSVLCQVDLTLRFAATSLLISLGMLLVGLWGFLVVVAS
jgi:preprotein translocase subunit Sss1